jgi:hypothetical protein
MSAPVSLVDIDAITTKRPRKRIKLFRQGELGRMILKALRESEAPSASDRLRLAATARVSGLR